MIDDIVEVRWVDHDRVARHDFVGERGGFLGWDRRVVRPAKLLRLVGRRWGLGAVGLARCGGATLGLLGVERLDVGVDLRVG